MVNLKQKIKDNKYVVGSWINSASPIVAELMASTGFDFLTVDVEHSAIDLGATQCLFQAIKAGNPLCAPLVRLKGHSYAETKRFMDAGADGIIAPLINSPEQAEEIIRAVKYPPQGMRGVGFCRANGYGLNLQESVKTTNEESFVCIQIEHVDALEKLDEILNVPGIDAMMVGPYDLSASMGITGIFDHPDMIKATATILKCACEHNIIPCIHVVQPNVQEVLLRYREGYRFIAYSLDITMLLNRCTHDLQEIGYKLTNLKG